MRYFKFPKWSKRFYPNAIWDFSHLDENSIYLTFDDGPHLETTTNLLNLLDKYNAKATFFCLGKNAKRFPELVNDIISRGHTIGNHGMNHLKGWNTTTEEYLSDAIEAKALIDSHYYRPAYGKMTRKQAKGIKSLGFKIVFWTVMSYDFDYKLNAKKRITKLKKLTKPGAIFVFHDSDKAIKALESDLEIMLAYWKGKRFTLRNFEQ